MRISLRFPIAAASTLAALYVLFPPGEAWAQYPTRSDFAQSRTVPTAKFGVGGTKDHLGGFARQPTPVPAAAPVLGPVTIPPVDSNSVLGSALASCDNLADGSEPINLPGARGEISLDRCYRGRDHLICSFNALLTEARALLEKYTQIAEANYPELGNLEAICSIPSNTLATDLARATEFNARFKALKLQFQARVSCVGSVQQSFRNMTLPDMTQAPDLLKSMVETIEGDIGGASDIQAQAIGLAEKIDASHKAMNTIQKVHRAMCAGQVSDLQNRVAR